MGRRRAFSSVPPVLQDGRDCRAAEGVVADFGGDVGRLVVGIYDLHSPNGHARKYSARLALQPVVVGYRV